LILYDDRYCFVCGERNPHGLKMDFSFDGRVVRAEFVPDKRYQGYMDILHGGIISTLLDEAMVRLAIEMGKPSVTARLDVRFKKAVQVGERLQIEAGILSEKKKIIYTYARAVSNGEEVAYAEAKLIRNVSEIKRVG